MRAGIGRPAMARAAEPERAYWASEIMQKDVDRARAADGGDGHLRGDTRQGFSRCRRMVILDVMHDIE